MALRRLSDAALIAATAVLLGTSIAAAQEDTGWIGQGQTYLRLDRFNNSGDASLSPFADEGFQRYMDFSGRFERAFTPANRLEIDLGGVLNKSSYRAEDEGVIFERLGVEWTNGDAKVPFRGNAGDYFADFSRRSLRRGVKGGQIELQPDFGDGRTHSIMLLSGTTERTWRDFDYDSERFTGASWLIGDTGLGAVALNVVRADIDSVSPETVDRSQTLTSLSLAPEFSFAGQRLTLDTEASVLRGDADVAGGARDETARGYFAELRGTDRGSTLTYSALYENNGANFVPAGGTAIADREAMEARASYRFEDGLSVSGRAFRFVDSQSGPAPRRTGSGGLTLSGPLARKTLPGATFYLDAFESLIATDGPGGDRRTGARRLDIFLPLDDAWTAGLNGFYGTDLERATGDQSVTREIGGRLTRTLKLAGWRGSLRAGMVGRTVSGAGQDSDEVGFNLAMSLRRGGHAFNASLDHNFSDGRTADGRNAIRSGGGFAYSYTTGQHSFGIDGVVNMRDQSPGNEVDAYRIGMFYRLTFGVGGHAAPSPGRAATLPDAEALATEGLALDLVAITPGLPISGAIKGLAREGLGLPRRQGPLAVYETPVLREIAQRQRLVLVSSGQRLDRSALVVDPAAAGDGRGLEHLYRDVLNALVDRYGAPDRVVEEGALGANPAQALDERRLIRIAEWDQDDSTVLRLGIPGRLDGIVRIEVQHARSFPPPRQTLWSIEEIR